MLTMRRLLFVLSIITLVAGSAAAALYYSPTSIRSFLPTGTPSAAFPIVSTLTDLFAHNVSTPAPLRFFDTVNHELTASGVIAQTNQERAQHNLPALAANAKLAQAAQIKLDDMFARQYFEHVSPDGKGPADLAATVGYSYLRIGENLALGNFAGDAGVVTAWMNSPGHRANILAPGYTEIGVAAREGIFNGQKVWIAVQEFGTPQSACPGPSQIIKKQIDQLQKQLAALEVEVQQKKADFEAAYAAWQEAYNDNDSQRANALAEEARAKQEVYNAAAQEYNALNSQLSALVKTYNKSVQTYNACAQKYT